MELSVKARYDTIKEHLNEKNQRLWLGNEALALGRGGISYVSKETGVARNTIAKGCFRSFNFDPLGSSKTDPP